MRSVLQLVRGSEEARDGIRRGGLTAGGYPDRNLFERPGTWPRLDGSGMERTFGAVLCADMPGYARSFAEAPS
jgi:hypothetical protein